MLRYRSCKVDVNNIAKQHSLTSMNPQQTVISTDMIGHRRGERGFSNDRMRRESKHAVYAAVSLQTSCALPPSYLPHLQASACLQSTFIHAFIDVIGPRDVIAMLRLHLKEATACCRLYRATPVLSRSGCHKQPTRQKVSIYRRTIHSFKDEQQTETRG